MDEKYLSVTSLLNEIKLNVEGKFRYVYIQGEIANWSRSSAGHFYYSVNDAQGSLSGALFKGDTRLIKDLEKIKDGEKVYIEGNISVYTKRSSIQLIAKKIVLQNKQGSLKEKFEYLKKKLASEGLFDIDRKRKIPAFPKKIAVITSPHGAAIQDFLKILMRNCFSYSVIVVPAVVQGDNSESSLVDALKKAQQVEDVEAIVLTRGGGSLEDLWSFNGEILAREIAECEIPVISAVGHEINFSISDFVADLRCETPSAAAEILSAPQHQFLLRFKNVKQRTYSLKENYLNILKARLYQVNPNRVLSLLWEELKERRRKLSVLNLNRINSSVKIHEHIYYLDELMQKVIRTTQDMKTNYANRLGIVNGMLESLSPKKVLSRGYLYLRKEGKIIPSVKEFKKIKNSDLDLHFFDGVVKINASGER